MTQFGRDCSMLWINIIRAHSPQAKGRVERSNGVIRIDLLRLEGISDIGRANKLLIDGFDDELNRHFAIDPGDTADYHQSAPGLESRVRFLDRTGTNAVGGLDPEL
jgi:hypothetical protein